MVQKDVRPKGLIQNPESLRISFVVGERGQSWLPRELDGKRAQRENIQLWFPPTYLGCYVATMLRRYDAPLKTPKKVEKINNVRTSGPV